MTLHKEVNPKQYCYAILLLTILLMITHQQCLTSYEYYDFTSLSCMPCGYSCQLCANSNTCDTCMDQYYLNNTTNLCQQCPFGCMYCTSSTTCITCNSGLYINSGGNCLPCTTGVSSCTIAVVDSCQGGYFLLSGICGQCLDNCYSCVDFITCTSCDSGYYLSANSQQCLSCSANCLICSDTSTCTQCAQGYTITNGVCLVLDCSMYNFCASCNSGGCTACKQGKYLDSNSGTCIQGASILCLQSVGPYYTNCDISNGCATYSSIQYDPNYGYSMPVCLPYTATQTSQYIYGTNSQSNCLSSSTCGSAYSDILTITTRKSYYQIQFNLNIRLYKNPSHTINISAINSTTQSIAATNIQTISIVDELSIFSQSQTNCPNCPYGQVYITGTLSSNGYQQSSFRISDQNGAFTIVEYVFVMSTCIIDNCQTCTIATDCTLCIQPYYLQMLKCVTECDAGYYLYQRSCLLVCPSGTFAIQSSYQCQACNSPCLTCMSASQCSSCISGYFLQGQSCVTSCSTAQQFGNTTSNKCQQCPNPCQTCYAVNSTYVKCLTCMAGYLYNQSSCVYVCPQSAYTTFLNEISQCQSCDSSCSQCYISDVTCSSCASGYLLYGSYCNHTTTCLSGYFISTNNTCAACQFPCATCQLLSTNCTSCLKGGLYQNSCYSACPSGYFMDYSIGNNITCQSCPTSCSTCLSLSACQSCVNGFYLLDSQCLSSCANQSYYANPSNNTCTLCSPPCKQCTSATACLSCLTGYLDGTTCTLQCNSSSYINSAFTCTLCPSPCTQCYSQTQCIQCLLPYVLNGGSCISVSDCQTLGMYVSYTMDSTNTSQLYGECKQCTYPCASCSISPIMCSTCADGYFYLSDLKTCQQQCSSTYYVSSTQCLKCSLNCYECSVSATNCTSCSTGTYLYSVNNSCVSQCPDGYYADNDQKSCIACVSPCATCYNVYFCKTCSVGIYYNKVCVTTCPSGTLYDSNANQCAACINNCLTCQVTTSNCTSCISGYFYNSDGTCTLTCQSGYYTDTYMQACEPCVSPCNTCISQTSCISCVTNYYLSSGSNCVLTCPNQYFANSTTYTCNLCNLTICDTCNLTASNCLSCANGYFFDSISSSCVLTCPSGQYSDSVTRTCKVCQFPCIICTNNSYCTQCSTNYKLYLNRCYSSCPVGYYGTTTCQQCPTNCQICTSQTSCSKCTTNYYVQNGLCVTNCSTGLYKGKQDMTNYDYCLQCPSNCQKCTDYTTCLLCDSGFYLFNGLCLTECPILHYAQTASMSCNSCPTNCVQCINATYCTQCINSYVYQHQCVTECPSKTYVFNQLQCIQCVSPCDSCLSQYECVTCISGYMYYHGYCVQKCPSGVWYYPSNNSCSSECPYNKYQSKMICYLSGCGGNMVVMNGYCLQSCPIGYYVSQQQSCISCSVNTAICNDLFIADLQILRSQQLSISLYYSQQAQTISSPDQVNVTFTNQNNEIIALNLSQSQFTPYSILMKYDYHAVEYLTVEVTIPYINSLTSAQAISQCYYTNVLYYFDDYANDSTTPMYTIAGIIPVIISAGLLICIIANIISKSSYFLQLLDFMQLIAACLYLDIQYPQYLQHYLQKLSLTLFSFMPSLMQHKPYAFSSPKFIYHNVDTSFTRTHLVTFIVFVVLVVVMAIVIVVDKYARPLPKLINRVKYRGLNDAFSIFAFPLMLFAFPFAHAIIIDIILGIIVILLTALWVVFISNLITQAKQMGDLLGLLSDYEAVSNKLGLMYTPFSYIRKIIVALLFANFPDKPLADLTLLLIFTILILICLFFYEPFASRVTDYVSMSLEFTLIIFIIFIILIGLDIFSQTANKVIASLAIILVLITMAVALGWLFYLTFGSMKKFIQNLSKDDKKDTENCVKQEKKSHDEVQPRLKQSEHQAQQSAANLVSPSKQIFRQSNINDGVESENHSRSNKQEFKHWNDEDQEVSEVSNKQNSNIKNNKSSGLPDMLMKKKIHEDHESEEQIAKQK